MYQLVLIILCSSLLLILHTYLFYPLGMTLFFSKSKNKTAEFSSLDECPAVVVLIAAYNEEDVIEQKIRSVYASSYPSDKLSVYVGSDASTDATNSIVETLCREFKSLKLVHFPGRVGKIGIVNHLQSLVNEPVLVLTDANVIFEPTTLFELVRKFKDNRVGLVAANIVKESFDNGGISLQEKKYLSLENRIKASESNAFNLIMGAEGGCYAVRNHLFTKVPPDFIVDDFFITMKVLEKGKYVVFNPTALCKEDVSGDMTGEYRRKVRISSGNFQNLVYFKNKLFRFWTPLSFAFLSHKVLRWFTPLLLFIALLSTAFLMPSGMFFICFFVLQLMGMFSPVADYFLKFKFPFLKFVSHFYLMNFALLEGFIKFVSGVKTNIWEPVKRNV